MGIVGSRRGIERIYLPESEKEQLKRRIRREFPHSEEGFEFLPKVQREFREYFDGRRRRFRVFLDFSRATPFQKKVYQAMSTIPFGEIRTYRWLAQKIGNPRALRAVGAANARNPWPLAIPCHRVVGSDGRLTGFSAPGGLALKEKLLKLEGIPVKKGRAARIRNSE